MNSDVVLLLYYVAWNAGVSSKSMLAAKISTIQNILN